MNENTPEVERRKRKSYTIFEKLQAVEDVRKKYGNNLSTAERGMKIGRKQLYELGLLKKANCVSLPRNRKLDAKLELDASRAFKKLKRNCSHGSEASAQ